jgi:hypothetical protein
MGPTPPPLPTCPAPARRCTPLRILLLWRRTIGPRKPPMTLLDLSGREIARRIAARETSATEVMTAALDRIDAVNGKVNALVSLRPRDDLMAEAAAADRALEAGERAGPLHGLPIAVKDLANVAGLRTSMGSPITDGTVAQTDDLFAARMRDAGAIFIGKANAPEFGLGSHTFNPVFGATLNPYAPTARPEAPRAGRARRWRRGCNGSATGPTPWDPCATRRAGTTSTVSARPGAAFRPRRGGGRGDAPALDHGAHGARRGRPGLPARRDGRARAPCALRAGARAVLGQDRGAGQGPPDRLGRRLGRRLADGAPASWSSARRPSRPSPTSAARSRRSRPRSPQRTCGRAGPCSALLGAGPGRTAVREPEDPRAAARRGDLGGRAGPRPHAAENPPRQRHPVHAGTPPWPGSSRATTPSSCRPPSVSPSRWSRATRPESPGARWTPITAGWRS